MFHPHFLLNYSSRCTTYTTDWVSQPLAYFDTKITEVEIVNAEKKSIRFEYVVLLQKPL